MIVTAKEMVEFILSQPDEKQINYAQAMADADCGCLMVQFGRYKKINFTWVGLSEWIDTSTKINTSVAMLEGDFCFDDFGVPKLTDLTTFGEAKKFCRENFPQFCGVDK